VSTQLTLFDPDEPDPPPPPDPAAARAAGEAAADACAANAARRGWDARAAGEFILAWLRRHGPTAGEVLVTEASRVHRPHDGRAFGAVIAGLSRRKLIEVCGHAPRAKGHGTAGGLVWKLTQKGAA
jgi:hypothetical protein